MTMKHLKIYLLTLFSLALAPSVHAALAPGKVQALLVVGDVQIVDSTGNRSPLTKGQTFEEGKTIVAGPASGATLVFSNGATIRVKENGQIKLDKFEQAPFDENKEGTFLRLTRDPSQSITELDLRNGTLQGEVKELNKAQNSSFTVKTPAGSAGIRGTVVSITVTRDASGNVTGVTATCVTGNIAFTPAAGSPTTIAGGGGTTQTISNSNVSVGSGGALQISLTTNASGQVTGASVTGAGATTAQSQAALADLFTAINTMRSAQNLPPVTPPTVTPTTGSVTVNGTAVPQVTLTTTEPSTATLTTIVPPSPPVNTAVAGTGGTGGAAGSGAASGSGSAGTGSGASTGSGAATSAPPDTGSAPPNPNTNPSVTVTPG